MTDSPLGAPDVLPMEGVDIGIDVDGSVTRLTMRATRALHGVATGRFARPPGGVTWTAERFAPGIEFCGFAFTQFALPVVGGPALDFDWMPADGVRSPPAVLPLIARAAGTVALLAPLTSAHEQVIAVSDGALTWGWHGDLDEVPVGFEASLAICLADDVGGALARWRRLLDLPTRPRSTNEVVTHLSYWTDNGAAYWYRTEPGRTIADSVVDVVGALRVDDVPVRAVEIDSWWYRHETARPILEIGYPAEVPPTGMMRWEPRADAFGGNGVGSGGDAGSTRPLAGLRERLDGAPLVLHARHISPRSPYVDTATWWCSGSAAHPHDPAFFRRWFDDAAAVGAVAIEQDWMLMVWFGVPELRGRPGRAAHWQRAMNGHAAATGVDLIWCMATPADLVEAARLDRVVAVRTSDDYRFARDPADLWIWFLTVNRLADALGLTVFKDVFFSNASVSAGADPIDGDAHAELEAALAALSGGPVGIGDRLGRTDRDIVMRTCDDDGRIRRVDRPVALVDDCLFGSPARGERLAWATTTATTDDGVWTYVLAINTSVDRRRVADRLPITRAVGGAGTAPGERARAVLDWRSGEWMVLDALDGELDARDWRLWLVAPSGSDVVAAASAIDDPARYVAVEATA